MWSTIFLLSKLHEGDFRKFVPIPVYEKSANLIKCLIFGNQTRYSSRLSIPMFIRTPCNYKLVVYKR